MSIETLNRAWRRFSWMWLPTLLVVVLAIVPFPVISKK